MKLITAIGKPWRKRAAYVFAWLAIVQVGGCSDGRPTRVPVSGRVLIDGQPLAAGNIRFHASANRPASGRIEADGRFTLSTYDLGDGCVTGRHAVAVTGNKLLNPRTMRWLAPKKYASAATSELTFEVNGPTDAAEIQLSWSGGKPFDENILGGGE